MTEWLANSFEEEKPFRGAGIEWKWLKWPLAADYMTISEKTKTKTNPRKYSTKIENFFLSNYINNNQLEDHTTLSQQKSKLNIHRKKIF